MIARVNKVPLEVGLVRDFQRLVGSERQNSGRICWCLHPAGAQEVARLWHPEAFAAYQGT